LAKLLAAVRPEFRAEVLAFDACDPVFGSAECRVGGCARPARARGLCLGHHQRWVDAGRPDLAEFAAAADPGWKGSDARPVPCRVAGCGYSPRGVLCHQHAKAWQAAGCPELAGWLPGAAPSVPPDPPVACRIGFCSLWARPSSPLCPAHDRCWKRHGSPELAAFVRGREAGPTYVGEHVSVAALPAQLRLEVQYGLQCRRDDGSIRTRPATARRIVARLAEAGTTSLLEETEEGWRRLCRDWYPTDRHAVPPLLASFRRRVEELAYGRGWEVEYPREVWRLRNLGVGGSIACLRFGAIGQPWLADLAKRWVRQLLAGGLSGPYAGRALGALTCFSAFLASPEVAVDTLAGIDRAVLERYLAHLQARFGGSKVQGEYVGLLGAFFQASRQHGWAEALPPTAMFFPEDFPKRTRLPPRALAEHVMAQLEHPDNLARWDNPAYLLITLILMRCGLRAGDALRLEPDCVTRDAAGAPYLRYCNHKMKREALVPIDEELEELIGGQRRRVSERWPGRSPVLFPQGRANPDGRKAIAYTTYKLALDRWLQLCNVRDEHGDPVHLTPHQWRHIVSA
jgi:integrase